MRDCVHNWQWASSYDYHEKMAFANNYGTMGYGSWVTANYWAEQLRGLFACMLAWLALDFDSMVLLLGMA